MGGRSPAQEFRMADKKFYAEPNRCSKCAPIHLCRLSIQKAREDLGIDDKAKGYSLAQAVRMHQPAGSARLRLCLIPLP